MTVLILAILAFFSSVSQAAGLGISSTADIVGRVSAPSDAINQTRIDVREAEIGISASVDPLFDGNVVVAAHQESGKAFLEVHEAYLSSTKLIPRTRIRVGQFLLGFGRLNQFHRHDWPFTFAPAFVTEFFKVTEAVIDTGGEVSYLFPFPFYLDLTAGITNGWVFGHAHELGNRPQVPTHYVRLATYTDLFARGGAQIGFNYVGRTDYQSDNTLLLGIDATAKWREGPRMKTLLQSEFWFEGKQSPSRSSSRIGYYVYGQYGIDSQWYVGARVDGWTNLSSTSNFDWAVGPSLLYKYSEFSTLRLGLGYHTAFQGSSVTAEERTIDLQGVFILGEHPAHDF